MHDAKIRKGRGQRSNTISVYTSCARQSRQSNVLADLAARLELVTSIATHKLTLKKELRGVVRREVTKRTQAA